MTSLPAPAGGPLPTVPEMLAANAAARPDRAALVAEDGTTVTHAGLWDQIAALRADLRRLGVGPADRVGVECEPGLPAALLTLGVACACTVVPLGRDLPVAELSDLLPRLQLAAVLPLAESGNVASAASALGIARLAAREGPGGRVRRLAGDAVGPALAPADATDPDAVAMLLGTSGTTGRAKIVPKTHRQWAASCRTYAGDTIGLGPEDRTLLLPPIHHALGLFTVAFALTSGGAIVCPEAGHLARLPDLVVRHDPTWITMPPTLLADLVARGRRTPGIPNPGLRVLFTGSAALHDDLRRDAAAVMGVPVLNSYGSTEASSLAAERAGLAPRPGTVGLAFPGVRIAEADGTSLPNGEAGEVQVRRDDVFDGYWDDPDLTAAAFTPDGWFRTGDRGILTDGYLTLLGRADDVINRGGQKIDPLEVEQVLAAHPDVVEAAVFGVPDPRLGEEVAAAVVLRPGARPTDRELRRWALDRLAPHKTPRFVVFHDALPRNANGKVLRRSLADLLADQPPLR